MGVIGWLDPDSRSGIDSFGDFLDHGMDDQGTLLYRSRTDISEQGCDSDDIERLHFGRRFLFREYAQSGFLSLLKVFYRLAMCRVDVFRGPGRAVLVQRNARKNADQAVKEWKLISQSSVKECDRQERVLPEGQLGAKSGPEEYRVVKKAKSWENGRRDL